MISEILETLSPEDAWDNRFKEATLDCECYRGWRRPELTVKCIVPGCQGGEIYTMLCERCSKDENGCFCSIEDFK